MILTGVSLKNFRNYKNLELNPSEGINIFHGDNAQGKTNFLEAIYVACTSKSHKASREREMISFESEEAHIKLNLKRKDILYRIDVHLRRNNTKGIAINGVALKRASELFGLAPVVMFSPEDLNIIKNGPAQRRRFLDVELCQLNKIYVHRLSHYNRVLNQKNKMLKMLNVNPEMDEFLEIYNEQLVSFGTDLIRMRREFIERLKSVIKDKHGTITDKKEDIEISYEPNVDENTFSSRLKDIEAMEKKNCVCLSGPQKDDIIFKVNGKDLRYFGSQGQQRSAVLSLKLAQINIIGETTGETPVLLLDDVLSELDDERQEKLLNAIGDIQTFITCTGLQEILNKRIRIDKIFKVEKGNIHGEN